MTEAEWLACDSPQCMIDFVARKSSRRKLRLFACACCRTLWDHLQEEVRKTVAAAERYADGLIRDSSVTGWYRRSMHARNRLEGRGRRKVSAYQSAIEAALPDQYFDRVRRVHEEVARAAADLAQGERAKAAWDAEFLAAARQLAPLLRDIVGDPFRRCRLDPAWLAWEDDMVRKMALSAYEDRTYDRLPILADALEEAGCTDAAVMEHLRGPGPRVRGCWVIDLLLGKM